MHISLRGLSIQDVATLAGLSYQAVYNILRVQRWPNPDTLMRIAKAVHSSPAKLLEGGVAQDRPDIHMSWKVLSEFMGSLNPARLRLLEAAAPLDDSEVLRYAEMIAAEAAAKAGTTASDEHTGSSEKPKGLRKQKARR